jgi:hypothetical protein
MKTPVNASEIGHPGLQGYRVDLIGLANMLLHDSHRMPQEVVIAFLRDLDIGPLAQRQVHLAMKSQGVQLGSAPRCENLTVL